MHGLATLQLVTLMAMLAVAVFTDLKQRRIPNQLTVSGLLAGLVIGALLEGGFPLGALGGALTGLLVALPVFALGGLGAGDVKLLTAVGAFVGAGGLLSVLVYGALAGGALAVLSSIRQGLTLGLLWNLKDLFLFYLTFGRRGRRIDPSNSASRSVPYGVAIAAGAVLTVLYPFSLAR